MKSLPQAYKPVAMTVCTTTNGGLTSGVVTLKGCIRAWIVVTLKQAVGHATVVSLRQSTTIALGSTAAGPVSKAWLNEDIAATDTAVEQTPAASVTVTNNIKSKQIIFEVDPAALTDGFPCVYISIGDSSQATNFANVEAFLEANFQQTTPPSAILD